jgi:predicted enzyme related to lactoylglutathione lyase
MADRNDPLIRAVDAIQIPVPDLEGALAFYRDALGHQLHWRTESEAGLGLPDGTTELVLTTKRPQVEPNLLVESAVDAAREFAAHGGSIEVPPFDIPVGRVAVVRDPFGNPLVLIDLGKGRYVTGDEGQVIGVE